MIYDLFLSGLRPDLDLRRRRGRRLLLPWGRSLAPRCPFGRRERCLDLGLPLGAGGSGASHSS